MPFLCLLLKNLYFCKLNNGYLGYEQGREASVGWNERWY